MKRKYYLIDTENVGDRWLDLPDQAGKKDHIISFYTEHHSNHLEKYLIKQVHNPKIVWLECAAGNNALDYQLIGVLSYLIAKHPKASYCIYSNDTDYQETVDFWKSRGIEIRTKGFALSEKKPNEQKKQNKGSKQDKTNKQDKANKQNKKAKRKQKTQTAGNQPVPADGPNGTQALQKKQKAGQETLGAQKKKTGRQAAQAVKKKKTAKQESAQLSKQQQKAKQAGKQAVCAQQAENDKRSAMQQVMADIAKCVPTTDLSSWYCIASAILGTQDGRVWYCGFKKDAKLRSELSVYYENDASVRGIHLVTAVLQAKGLNPDGAGAAYEIIVSHGKDDLKGIKQAFDQKFDRKLRQKYYRTLKPLVKVIHKIA